MVERLLLRAVAYMGLGFGFSVILAVSIDEPRVLVAGLGWVLIVAGAFALIASRMKGGGNG